MKCFTHKILKNETRMRNNTIATQVASRLSDYGNDLMEPHDRKIGINGSYGNRAGGNFKVCF
jgi:hypothetical protein